MTAPPIQSLQMGVVLLMDGRFANLFHPSHEPCSGCDAVGVGDSPRVRHVSSLYSRVLDIGGDDELDLDLENTTSRTARTKPQKQVECGLGNSGLKRTEQDPCDAHRGTALTRQVKQKRKNASESKGVQEGYPGGSSSRICLELERWEVVLLGLLRRCLK